MAFPALDDCHCRATAAAVHSLASCEGVHLFAEQGWPLPWKPTVMPLEVVVPPDPTQLPASAAALNLPERTVRRDWNQARLLLSTLPRR